MAPCSEGAVQASLFGAGTGSRPGSMPRPAQQGPDPGRGGGVTCTSAKGNVTRSRGVQLCAHFVPVYEMLSGGGGGERSVRFNLKVNFFHQNEKPRKNPPKMEKQTSEQNEKAKRALGRINSCFVGGRRGEESRFFSDQTIY